MWQVGSGSAVHEGLWPGGTRWRIVTIVSVYMLVLLERVGRKVPDRSPCEIFQKCEPASRSIRDADPKKASLYKCRRVPLSFAITSVLITAFLSKKLP